MRKKVINNVSTQPRLWTLSVRTNERPWCRLIEPTLLYASCTSAYQPQETSSNFHWRKSATLKTGRLTRAPPWQLTQPEALACLDQEWHGGVWWPGHPNRNSSSWFSRISLPLTVMVMVISLNLLTLLFEDESQERAVFRWMVLPGPSENLPGLSKAHPSPQPRSPPSKLGPYPHTCLSSDQNSTWSEPKIWT